MSDLLGRMIARARGAVSPIEPVLSSVYAPSAPVLEPEPEPAPATDVAYVPLPAPIEHPPRARAAKQPRPEIEPQPEAPLRMPETRTPEASTGVHDYPATAPQVRAIVMRETQTEPVASAPAREAREPSREEPHSLPIVLRNREQADPLTVPGIPAPPPATEVAAVREPVVPRELLRIERTSRVATQPRELAAAAPVEVHVSIGHIEVRQPPAPVKPAGATLKPRVTLDDYLRRRNGERG